MPLNLLSFFSHLSLVYFVFKIYALCSVFHADVLMKRIPMSFNLFSATFHSSFHARMISWNIGVIGDFFTGFPLKSLVKFSF